ncbi:zinc-ribbon domain containing protein [Candidatus Peregrinibacteria bacterium]|nr:zinc-ribbon domain containing protein [Candidatus Peregrinibacteria bacterium]
MNHCKQCKQNFEITDADNEFYQTLKIPAPTLCPACRQQRRLTWRNERTLYKRKCDATGKDIVSVFSPDKPFTVYDNEYWYSDKWNPMDYGRDFDFNRPFFEQFNELNQKVPQLSRCVFQLQNCDFVNQVGCSKNCYLIFEADFNENCYYSNNIFDSKVCIDLLMCVKCELCYESIDCENCYNLKHSQGCKNSSDSWFLKNSIGCRNCFGCTNLRNKEYYFLNEKLGKDQYAEKLKAMDLGSYHYLQKARENFLDFSQKYPHKYLQGNQNENSTGNYLFNTQNCSNCFDSNTCQDCKYLYNCRYMKKCYDITCFGNSGMTEFCCDNHCIEINLRNVCFSDQIWEGCNDIFYSTLCVNNCRDLFGCVGLKHKQYCILNKQYSEADYKALRAKIVEHMQKTGEFGEFFPSKISPFAYNETVAMEHFPLSKAEAIAKGYKWKDLDPKEYLKQKYKIPEDITQVPDTIFNEILACVTCGKNYKIIPEELKFYRLQSLPIPLKCHDCRHKDRLKLRNKRTLYPRTCQKCSLPLETTYAPERLEPIYCEKCYQEAAL